MLQLQLIHTRSLSKLKTFVYPWNVSASHEDCPLKHAVRVPAIGCKPTDLHFSHHHCETNNWSIAIFFFKSLWTAWEQQQHGQTENKNSARLSLLVFVELSAIWGTYLRGPCTSDPAPSIFAVMSVVCSYSLLLTVSFTRSLSLQVWEKKFTEEGPRVPVPATGHWWREEVSSFAPMVSTAQCEPVLQM